MITMTLYQSIKEASKNNPNGLALYYEGKKISFKTLLKRIDLTAAILYNDLGVRENDIVIVSQPNIPTTIVLFYALNKIGAISHLVHPFTPYNQVKAIMEKTHAKTAFLFEQRIAKEVDKYRQISNSIYVSRIEDDLPFFKKIFYHTFMNFKIRKKLAKNGRFEGFKYIYKLKSNNKNVPNIVFDPSRTSVLLPSGSTTGEPKTICISDNSFNYIASHAETYFSLSKKELYSQKMLSVLPSFHGFGLCMTMHTPLYNGFASILLPKFKPKKVAKALDKTKFTLMCGVPTIYEKLLNEPRFATNKNLKYLRGCFCGGDTLSNNLINGFNNMLKDAGSISSLFQGYGLTEVLAVNCLNTLDFNRNGSLGKAVPGSVFKIVDENGQEVKKNEIGEITIKSPAVMVGYYQDEKATNECLIDGYLYTGDYGYIDDDDFIFYKSRKKRVVKVSGVAVFPCEVEQLIESIPEVMKCAAISIPDAKLQNSIKVFVVAKYFDETAMKEKIFDTCRKYLIRWSVPTEIEFRNELPVTRLGKVDFNSLQMQEDKKRALL